MKLWQTVDNLIHHVVHTMTSSKLTNIQSVIHKLPEEIQQGLQCIQLYQNRKNSSSLQSLHSNSSLSSKTSLNSKRDSKTSLKSKRDSQSSLSSKRGSKGSVCSVNKPNISNQSKSVTFKDSSCNQSGNANSSANSDSYTSGSHSAIQNTTVILNRLGEHCSSGEHKSVNDKTVVVSQNLSDTKNESLRSSVSSHQSSEESLDGYSLQKTDNFRPSCRTKQDETCDSNQSSVPAGNGRNMNITEEKMLNYNQNKVSSQLRGEPARREELSRREKCGSVYDNIVEEGPTTVPTSNEAGMTK